MSAPCSAGHAPELTINGTAFTVVTDRIVGNTEVVRAEQFPQLEVEVLAAVVDDPRMTRLIQQIVIETLDQ